MPGIAILLQLITVPYTSRVFGQQASETLFRRKHKTKARFVALSTAIMASVAHSASSSLPKRKPDQTSMSTLRCLSSLRQQALYHFAYRQSHTLDSTHLLCTNIWIEQLGCEALYPQTKPILEYEVVDPMQHDP